MTSEMHTGGEHRTRFDDGVGFHSPSPGGATDAVGDMDVSHFSDEETLLEPGMILDDQFRIERTLRRGRTGVVYDAVDLLSEQRVALKVALPSALRDGQECAQFVRAAHAARLLNHQAFACVFDVRRVGPLVFFSMEPLSGTTLREVLQKQGKLPLPQALWIVEQIADALATCNSGAHGALSPEHVLLLGQSRIKLLAFGCGPLRAYATGPYCPPEARQANAAGSPAAAYDARRDSYALGILLFEMLLGSVPRGDATDRERLAQLPLACQDLIRRCASAQGERINDFSTLRRLVSACKENPTAPLPAESIAALPQQEGPGAYLQDIMEEVHKSPSGSPRRPSARSLGTYIPDWETLGSLVGSKTFLLVALGCALALILVPLLLARGAGSGPAPGTVRTFAGIEMVWVPSGSFTMGQSFTTEQKSYFGYGLIEAETIRFKTADELPQHKVRLSEGFWMSRYVVTEDQWRQYVGDVQAGATWQECQDYLGILNALGEGRFRLPTEAEWEYACRAGTKTAYWFGDEEAKLKEFADQPNPWGLYNIHGSIDQWCSDWYGYDYDFPGATRDPQGPERTRLNPRWSQPGDEQEQFRVVRGGGRSSQRGYHDCREQHGDSTRTDGAALRLVRDPSPTDTQTEEKP